jgi:predicted  nucleic acid-binding Zn-ribbon protein
LREYVCLREGEIAAIKKAVEDLERWQEQQNGALIRLSNEMADVDEKFDKKIDELKAELRRLLFTALITLISVLANIIIKEVFR